MGKDMRTAAVWVLQGVTGAEQIHSPLLLDAQGCRRKSPKADAFPWGWGNSERAVNQSQDANNGLPPPAARAQLQEHPGESHERASPRGAWASPGKWLGRPGWAERAGGALCARAEAVPGAAGLRPWGQWPRALRRDSGPGGFVSCSEKTSVPRS